MIEEQTTLKDFDIWDEKKRERVERVLPWLVLMSDTGIEDNILQFYERWTDEDIEDNIEILRDQMTDSELEVMEQGCPWNFSEGFPFNDIDDRFIEQEDIIDSPIKWKIIWESESRE